MARVPARTNLGEMAVGQSFHILGQGIDDQVFIKVHPNLYHDDPLLGAESVCWVVSLRSGAAKLTPLWTLVEPVRVTRKQAESSWIAATDVVRLVNRPDPNTLPPRPSPQAWDRPQDKHYARPKIFPVFIAGQEDGYITLNISLVSVDQQGTIQAKVGFEDIPLTYYDGEATQLPLGTISYAKLMLVDGGITLGGLHRFYDQPGRIVVFLYPTSRPHAAIIDQPAGNDAPFDVLKPEDGFPYTWFYQMMAAQNVPMSPGPRRHRRPRRRDRN